MLDPTIRKIFQRNIKKITKRMYVVAINHFCRFLEMKPSEVVNSFKKMSNDEMVRIFGDYIKYGREKINSDSLNLYLSKIRMWLFENDVDIYPIEKQINRIFKKYVGRLDTTLKGDIITKDQIIRLLKVADPLMKAVITMLACSGMRIDTLLKLKSEHFLDSLKDDKNCYAIEIPRESSKIGEPYIALITYEAATYLKQYMKIFKPDKHIFNKSYITIHSKFNELCKKANIDRRIQKTKARKIRAIRLHSFRKYFKTTCSVYKVDRMVTEALMGHSLTKFGIESIYDYSIANINYLRSEYEKAIPGLTFQLNINMKKLEEKYSSQLKDINKRINNLYTLIQNQQTIINRILNDIAK